MKAIDKIIAYLTMVPGSSIPEIAKGTDYGTITIGRLLRQHSSQFIKGEKKYVDAETGRVLLDTYYLKPPAK